MSSQMQKRNRTALLRLFSRRRDAWTGVNQGAFLSREEFEEQLAIERARVERSGYSFSVIVFTIHGAGDSEEAVRAEKAKKAWPSIDPWLQQLREWQELHPLVYEQIEDGPLKPQYVIDTLRDNTPDDTIVASGVGQHQM